MVEKNEKCCVCGGSSSEDGGLYITKDMWFCCSGCYCDYYIGKSILKTTEKDTVKKFTENIESYIT